MVIKVESVPAEKFAELVSFIDGNEVLVPRTYNNDTGKLFYGDNPEKIKPVVLHCIKQGDDNLYTFNIVILQRRKVGWWNNDRMCGEKVISLPIPRCIIDSILDILDFFPKI